MASDGALTHRDLEQIELDKLRKRVAELEAELNGPTNFGPEDGTERLVQALHGRSAKPRDYLGGSNARMLHEAAERIRELEAAINGLISTGLNGGNSVRLALLAAKRTELDSRDLTEAEASEKALQYALSLLPCRPEVGE